MLLLLIADTHLPQRATDLPLPEVARRTVEGVSIAAVHETADKRGRSAYCDARFAGTDLLVFGRSHAPWDSVTPGGIRLLNPGSCVDRRMQPHRTYLTLQINDGTIGEPVLHRLAKEGQPA